MHTFRDEGVPLCGSCGNPRVHLNHAASTIVERDGWQQLATSNRAAVRELGNQIGYGNMMHLARDEWRVSLLKADHAGGEFAVGCCVALTVPCGCTYPCDWCNGCGWLTPKVAEMRTESQQLRDRVQDLTAVLNEWRNR